MIWIVPAIAVFFAAWALRSLPRREQCPKCGRPLDACVHVGPFRHMDFQRKILHMGHPDARWCYDRQAWIEKDEVMRERIKAGLIAVVESEL